MVVLEVDIDCVLAIEGERQAQIAGDIDRPAIALIAPQRVEAPPRDAHVLRPDRGIQPVKHAFNSSITLHNRQAAEEPFPGRARAALE